MKGFESLRNEVLELLESNARFEDRTKKLINDILALGNSEIKIYYNLSIISFEYLLKNTNFEEYKKVLKSLEPQKPYIIKDREELIDYLRYLESEGEQQLHDDIVKSLVEVNDNLFIFEAI